MSATLAPADALPMIGDDIPSAIAAVARIDAVPTILELVCRATGMGFAAIARVTEARWVACGVRDGINFGLKPGSELEIQKTFCDTVRRSGVEVVFDDVAEDVVYRDHPIPAMYGIQSYISVPILHRDGRFFGTLCAIDVQPARVNTPEIIDLFRLMTQLIAFNLDSEDRMATAEASLRVKQRDAELREEFIAILGHDLRNPLAAIVSAMRLMGEKPPGLDEDMLIGVVERSAQRMAGLITQVMDFTRERLGDGLPVDRTPAGPLAPTLAALIEETRFAWPGRVIQADVNIGAPVDCDHVRIGQLLSNLLANALTHGDADQPVHVRAWVEKGVFGLQVTNAGTPIPPEVLGHLFQPFFRAGAQRNRSGLGLGLYIASGIARAHGGTLGVTSTPAATCFTFRMPVQAIG
ncbi:GAF domain-containing sensor histidine kinase [Humitalea sp. 24SJ18S-53]|uniref:GAF domain-containing sensor histidine kinase n=1 Tax=Humitalea sp. 24SJ18S-53 TaxID=3422307 RepID=UPI003D66C154